eukprot:365973-Chlamydomonas_euryale.AAC.13
MEDSEPFCAKAAEGQREKPGEEVDQARAHAGIEGRACLHPSISPPTACTLHRGQGKSSEEDLKPTLQPRDACFCGLLNIRVQRRQPGHTSSLFSPELPSRSERRRPGTQPDAEPECATRNATRNATRPLLSPPPCLATPCAVDDMYKALRDCASLRHEVPSVDASRPPSRVPSRTSRQLPTAASKAVN